MIQADKKLDEALVEKVARAIDNYAHFQLAANRDAAAKAAITAALPTIERRAQEKLLRDMLAFFKGNSPDVSIFMRAHGLSIDQEKG